MPFDGTVTLCVASELNRVLGGGRIERVFQPEKDEVNILVRSSGANYRLLLSANSSHPRVHIARNAKDNPAVPPTFCMVLRKYLIGGKILSVSAENLERVIKITVESYDEMGDISVKTLIAEIMGKHSNILLINENLKIIDALKHIDSEVNRVREIMPARDYVPPPSQSKLVPGDASPSEIVGAVASAQDKYPMKRLDAALLDTIMGFSPVLCRELCHRAGIQFDTPLALVNKNHLSALEHIIGSVATRMRNGEYAPCLIYDSPDTVKGKLLDFHCFSINVIGFASPVDGINDAIDSFYYQRGKNEALRQKKAHLLKLVGNNLDRCKRKMAIQQENMRESANKDKYKLYGELLQANVYAIVSGSKSATVQNYYSEGGEFVDIPLNEDLSPQANAQVYYKKYRKAKATWLNANIQYEESLKELIYLESVLHELEASSDIHEIDEVRQELASQKYVSSSDKPKKLRQNNPAPVPHLFYSSDGLRVYVGKNNRQNDILTLKTASSGDIWLHVKNMPGSHVVIKKEKGEIPNQTVFEGAMLAALFSKARMGSNVDVDFTEIRNVKKPQGAKPGMVVYVNHRTIVVTPDPDLPLKLKLGGHAQGRIPAAHPHSGHG